MRAGAPELVLRFIRKLAIAEESVRLPDRALLERFLNQHDETAFATLVRRHGPMVFRVCLQVLHDEHDAEDAFQATFLILSVKAAMVKKQESVGSWLYGVANHAAANLRRNRLRRQAHESQVLPLPSADPLATITVREAEEIVHQELLQLPEKCRVALVLCSLEGLTRDEAARHLGWSLATLKSRLEYARKLLRSRLASRGLTLAAAATVSLICEQVASATLPCALLTSTTKAATIVAAGGEATSVVSAEIAALAKGVMGTMLLTKVKIVTAVLFVVALACYSLAVFSYTETAVGLTDAAKKDGPQAAAIWKKGSKVPEREQTAKEEKAAKAAPTAIKVQVMLEEINVKGKHSFVTGTLRISQPVGGELISSKLVDIPLAEDAKIRIGDKDCKLSGLKADMSATLQLVVDQGGLVVVGIQIIEKKP